MMARIRCRSMGPPLAFTDRRQMNQSQIAQIRRRSRESPRLLEGAGAAGCRARSKRKKARRRGAKQAFSPGDTPHMVSKGSLAQAG